MTPALVLASTSPYRAALLRRLTPDFIQVKPEVEELSFPGETPLELALRLAEVKARALAVAFPDHLIIGSDQTAACDNDIIGKPGHRAAAVAQILASAGGAVAAGGGASGYSDEGDDEEADPASGSSKRLLDRPAG